MGEIALLIVIKVIFNKCELKMLKFVFIIIYCMNNRGLK